jgi:hypothetical protein
MPLSVTHGGDGVVMATDHPRFGLADTRVYLLAGTGGSPRRSRACSGRDESQSSGDTDQLGHEQPRGGRSPARVVRARWYPGVVD